MAFCIRNVLGNVAKRCVRPFHARIQTHKYTHARIQAYTYVFILDSAELFYCVPCTERIEYVPLSLADCSPPPLPFGFRPAQRSRAKHVTPSAKRNVHIDTNADRCCWRCSEVHLMRRIAPADANTSGRCIIHLAIHTVRVCGFAPLATHQSAKTTLSFVVRPTLYMLRCI